MSRSRLLVWIALVLVSGAALFLAFAWPGGASAPRTQAFALEGFRSPTGEAALDDRRVRAATADGAGVTLLRQDTPGLQASDWRFLDYRMDAPAAGAKRMLLWRSAAGTGSASLPDAAGTLDLSRHPGWSGAIDWIGVANAPVDYLAAGVLPSSVLELRYLALRSSTTGAAAAALWTDWRVARPWSGRSLNTGGFELGAVAGPSLTLFVALWAALAAALARPLLGGAATRRLAPGIVVAAAALLAAQQVVQLAARGRDAAAAAASATVRAPLAAQPQLAAAAVKLAEHFDRGGARPRLLVHGANQFLGEYTTWLLRTHDAAMLWEPAMLPAAGAAGDWRVVLVGAPDATFDPVRGVLRLGAQERAAALDLDLGVLKSYRLQSGAAP